MKNLYTIIVLTITIIFFIYGKNSFFIYNNNIVSYFRCTKLNIETTNMRICYDTLRKIPIYTIHYIDQRTIDDKNFRISGFKEEKHSAENLDFYKSGFDKGHMIPAEDFDFDADLKKSTYTLYNVCPMTPSFNRSTWRSAEYQSRKLLETNKDLTVISLPLSFSDSLLNDISIPIRYLKCNAYNKKIKCAIFQEKTLPKDTIISNLHFLIDSILTN